MIFVGFKNIDIEELILKILKFFFIIDTVLQTVHGSNCLVAVSWPGRNRNRKGSIITKLHWTAKKYPQLRVSGLRLADSDFDHIPKKNVQKNVRCLQILQRFWFRIRVFKTRPKSGQSETPAPDHYLLLGDPEVTAYIYCKSRKLPNTDTQIYSTHLR